MAIETTSSSLGLPPLPYSENALEPIISARQLVDSAVTQFRSGWA
jgi:hypothetical protein